MPEDRPFPVDPNDIDPTEDVTHVSSDSVSESDDVSGELHPRQDDDEQPTLASPLAEERPDDESLVPDGRIAGEDATLPSGAVFHSEQQGPEDEDDRTIPLTPSLDSMDGSRSMDDEDAGTLPPQSLDGDEPYTLPPVDDGDDEAATIPSGAMGDSSNESLTEDATLTVAGPESDARRMLERLTERQREKQRYRVEKEIGRGGMGVILKVLDEDLNRSMAMKVVLGSEQAGSEGSKRLPPQLLDRFFEEAQVTGQLVHPGIVPVHELGVDDSGRAYFTMQLVEGRDLRQIFKLVKEQEEGWTRTRALGVMLKVCEAMAYAHSKGVIHRDLKPANIMVGRFGEVYVMDWGLARVLSRPESREGDSWVFTYANSEDSIDSVSEARTLDGNIIGTPSYMSPEQARGRISELDERTDVYSVGALLYELLSGRRPYTVEDGENDVRSILERVYQGPPAPLSSLRRDISPEMIAICDRAMAADPRERYADMGELAEDLRAYLEDRVVSAYRTGSVAELKKWVVRNRGLAASIALSILLAVGGLSAVSYVESQGRRAANEERKIAERNERKAVLNAEEARRQQENAQRERSNVLRLAAFQKLEDLTREADRLWPAYPEIIPPLEDWLVRAESVVAGLWPDPVTGDPGHYAQLERIRSRALPATPQEREAWRLEDPRYDKLQSLRAERDVLETAAAVRRGDQAAIAFELDERSLPVDAESANNLAWTLVDPDRQLFGREPEGLALSRHAVSLSEGANRALYLDTLAWALFANGLDDEALAASQEAIELAPNSRRREFEGYFAKLSGVVEAIRREGEADLLRVRRSIDALQQEMEADPKREWRFAEDEDRWWHAQLTKLVAEIETFADPEHGLIEGRSSRHHWGIRQRLELAKTIRERSIDGPEASALWAEAIASIRDVELSPAYGGLVMRPQIGLLPLGQDPQSGLWEFVHLQTGEPPVRDGNGELVITERTGLVFVLLPGGRFLMGSQTKDPEGQNYSAFVLNDEAPVHPVELSPFFLSKYEMTQAQWARFTSDRPSRYGLEASFLDYLHDGRHPVEQVSWDECQVLTQRLGLRLPSEAQWEFAARGNTQTPWYGGPDRSSLLGQVNIADQSAARGGANWKATEDWPEHEDGYVVHAPVGTYAPNPFGLHDMYGNVSEWCLDGYRLDFYSEPSGRDPVANPSSSLSRVYRGGAFSSTSDIARSAMRLSTAPENKGMYLGVRPARPLER
ncbi:MAG: SUMF1/EgtB/PvdO family nonheme iron enzyme [Planctomycetota bacterium]